MAIWKRTLNIADIFSAVAENELPHKEGIEQILERLRKVEPYEDENIEQHRKSLEDEIECMIDDDNDEYDFDYVLEMLYIFGDIKLSGDFFDAVKAMWVKTQ